VIDARKKIPVVSVVIVSPGNPWKEFVAIHLNRPPVRELRFFSPRGSAGGARPNTLGEKAGGLYQMRKWMPSRIFAKKDRRKCKGE
jgi:hypothetical protein